MDEKDLKIRGLLERLSVRENEVADLRVQLTITSQHLDQAQEVIRQYEESAQAVQTLSDPAPVEAVDDVFDVSPDTAPEA